MIFQNLLLGTALFCSVTAGSSRLNFYEELRDCRPILEEKSVTIEKKTRNITVPTEEDIAEEERLGQMEMLAQLIQAEAGNQSLTGMRLVADVVLNRVDSPQFPNTIEDVIFDDWQFELMYNGYYDKVAWEMSPEAFQSVWMEVEGPRLDSDVLYFSTYPANGTGFWKCGDHWFSY